MRTRFWIEATLAFLTGSLTVLTLVTRDWIEVVFGVDPDHGSGSLEWLIVAGLLALTLGLVVLAARERRYRPAS